MPDRKSDSILPQIKSTVANILIILFGAPLAGVGLSYLNGELLTWKDIPKALDHGFFIGFCMTCAWLCMASPVGLRFRALISSIQTPDGKKELQVELGDSPIDSDTKRTTTINPKTQTVTIKDEPVVKPPDLPDNKGSDKKD